MSRTLIVFYSRTGTTRQAARQLQQLTQWPVGEIRDCHPRVRLLGDLRCIADSLLALPAHFTYDGPALQDFDRVILFTPIWLGLLASPLRGFLGEQFRDETAAVPHLSLVCVASGKSSARAAAEVATYAGHAPTPVISLAQNEVLSGSGFGALASLADAVQTLDTWPAVRRPLWLSPKAA